MPPHQSISQQINVCLLIHQTSLLRLNVFLVRTISYPSKLNKTAFKSCTGTNFIADDTYVVTESFMKMCRQIWISYFSAGKKLFKLGNSCTNFQNVFSSNWHSNHIPYLSQKILIKFRLFGFPKLPLKSNIVIS